MFLVALSACASREAKMPAPRPPARVPTFAQQEVIAGILRAGKQAAVEGQYDRAIALFSRVQEGYPNAPERSEATLLLAQAFEKKGELTLALTEYRRLASEFSQSPQAVVARTKIPELERQLPLIRPPAVAQLTGVYVAPEGMLTLDEREIARLRQSGANTIVVGVAGKAGVYFKTDWAPVLRDSLGAVVSAAHRQGMRVWASVSVRRMDWIDPTLEWTDWKFNSETASLERAETLDLLHPALRDYFVGFFTDLAATGVDGIFLVADPFSAASEGFSPHALKRYERDSGQPINPGRLLPAQGRERPPAYAPEFWRWAGWKQREQFKVMDSATAAVRALYPGLRVAVEVHPEAITNPQAALASYAEDVLDLRRSRADYIAVAVSSSSALLMKKVTEIVRGNRLLLLVDPSEKNSIKSVTLPSGTGLIYKEKSGQTRLTNQGR
jgi:tetratricopeptide (TPR) repeat protein